MSIREQMENVPMGVNSPITCPHCGEKEASAIKHDDGLVLWNCFRATCGKKGFWFTVVPYGDSQVRPAFQPKDPPMSILCDTEASIVPLFSFDGEMIGQQSRDKHKTIRNWMRLDRVPYCYVPPEDSLEFGFPLWLVEDIRSAETLADNGQPAVALLGTTIKDRFIEEELIPWVGRNHTPKILVALDPDATITAMKQGAMLARTLCHAALAGNLSSVPSVQWVPLALDIKDMTRTRIQDLILAYAEVNQ